MTDRNCFCWPDRLHAQRVSVHLTSQLAEDVLSEPLAVGEAAKHTAIAFGVGGQGR